MSRSTPDGLFPLPTAPSAFSLRRLGQSAVRNCNQAAARPRRFASKIRMVRLGQADPLILVILDWIFGADVFLPIRDQAPVGDKDSQRRGEHVRVLHRQFELQSLYSRVGVNARRPV